MIWAIGNGQPLLEKLQIQINLLSIVLRKKLEVLCYKKSFLHISILKSKNRLRQKQKHADFSSAWMHLIEYHILYTMLKRSLNNLPESCQFIDLDT